MFAFACSLSWIFAGDVCHLPGMCTPGKGLEKDDRNNHSYGKTSGGVIMWLRTHQPGRAMVQACKTLRTEEVNKEYLSMDCFSTKIGYC